MEDAQKAGEEHSEGDFQQLVNVFKGSVFMTQLLFALILKTKFVH